MTELKVTVARKQNPPHGDKWNIKENSSAMTELKVAVARKQKSLHNNKWKKGKFLGYD